MGRKVGEKEKFSFGRFWRKKVRKVTKLRSGYAAKLPACFYRKDANLANPLTSDARSVMLRIPLPEDDGFALALHVASLALKGRQSTDGGERSVTPDQPPPSPCPLPCAVGAGRGCY